MSRLWALAAGVSIAAVLGGTASAADSLLTESHKVLPLNLAIEAAQAALQACEAQGYKMTVTVVDRTGAVKAVLVGDGAGKLGAEITFRKAYTAATLRVSSGEFGKRVAGGGFNPGVFDPQLTTAQGGVPIKVGDDTIAAIGAGGAPGGDKDEACANAGIAKISERLR
ncbi:MAG TPA: heme-binding protein [Stellaceae bacterium]|nr:heme-binding protein [Stellaceae bacterium]